jgi:hypothetical protein
MPITRRSRPHVAIVAEIAVQCRRHPRGWVVVPLQLPLQPGAFLSFEPILNTGRPRSVISPNTERSLSALGLLEPIGARQYRIPGLHVDGDRLPDMIVRASAGPALLGLDGMLGWDYLRQFDEVRIEPRTLRVTFAVP